MYCLSFEHRYVFTCEFPRYEADETNPYFRWKPHIAFTKQSIREHADELLADYRAAGLPLPRLYICCLNDGKETRTQYRSRKQ
jgi:hypothetical protein